MKYHLAVGLLSFALCYLFLPLAIRLARSRGFLDHPDGVRRVHPAPVPRIGGVVIFGAACLSALLGAVWLQNWDLRLTLVHAPWGVFVGGALVFLLGFIDDIRGVKPVLKLAVQVLAAGLVVYSGFTIDHLALSESGLAFSLGVFAVPLTILWIVGMTNAFNLIDGIDGLAGTFALIAFSGALVAEFLLRGASVSVLSVALLGAVFAFLRYNRTPAKVFLGDSGSMTLGFVLSVRAATASTSGDVTYFLVAIGILAYPITDTAVAIARRWLRGHPLSRADGRHVHHQIRALDVSPQRTVQVLGLFFAGVAASSIMIVFAPAEVTLTLATIVAVLTFVTFFYAIRLLRYSEFMEVGASVASVFVNARRHIRLKLQASEVAQRIEGANSLSEVHSILEDSAEDFEVLQVELLSKEPSLYGPERRQIAPVDDRPWRVEFPIFWEANGATHEVVLRLWCLRPRGYRHVGAERIATRLAPAVEHWVRTHPEAFVDTPRDGVTRESVLRRQEREIQAPREISTSRDFPIFPSA